MMTEKHVLHSRMIASKHYLRLKMTLHTHTQLKKERAPLKLFLCHAEELMHINGLLLKRCRHHLLHGSLTKHAKKQHLSIHEHIRHESLALHSP